MLPTVESETEDITQGTSVDSSPSSVSNERASSERTQVAKSNLDRELTLNMLIKELVFCVALALTTYGALHNTPSKVSKVPQPERFFPSDSVVIDWYRGQLSNALSSMSSEDISFVMYYAPWDAESQFVRGEFEKAANILSDRVHFAAINCWNPGSECRSQHNKIPSWPILVAYTVTSRGVLYKGPRNAESMVKFLELIMKPLEKISNTEDLVNLLSICDAVAVGFTPLTGTSRSYNIWYNVALKAYEYDPIGELCFGAVTSADLASDLGVENLPNARLMLWNDTKEYKSEDSNQSWNETFLANWLLENFSQPVARIIPMWKKSLNFNRYLDGNPMLILFTPLNPLYEQLPSYALLREVAMEYYSCRNNASNDWTSELIKLQQVKRLLYHKRSYIKFCQEYKYNKPAKKTRPQYRKAVVAQNNKYPWINVTQKNQKSGVANFLLKQGIALSKLIERSNDNSGLWTTLGFLENCGESSAQLLPAEKGYYENYEKCQSFEEQFNNDFEMEQEDVETSMLPYDDDPLSSENLWHEHVKHFCSRMQFANSVSPPVAPAKVNIQYNNIAHIHGPPCNTNYTIAMIAVDSMRNYHFAESLGVDIKNKKDMTAVVILDSKHESQYVLSEEYSAKSIRDFIYNFTQKRLNRTLRSRIDDATHTHYFGSVGATQPDGKNDSAVHILDLTTHTFKEVVKTPGTVTVLAVCGGGCGALVSRALVHAARVLGACGVRVQPARLDALRHDLPWQYTPHAHPTLLVFPAHRRGEAESRAFPSSERVTGSGVVALALRSLGVPTHLRVSLTLCAQPKVTTEKVACLKNMRDHVTTAIGRNLKYWRRTDNELRNSLFKRLQHLHDVALHLSLFHITDLKQDNTKQNTLLQSLDRLSKIWDIDESLLRKNVIPKPIVTR